jgi:CRP/FNR family transcriptional regulator, cyclic AMP receptor protein
MAIELPVITIPPHKRLINIWFWSIYDQRPHQQQVTLIGYAVSGRLVESSILNMVQNVGTPRTYQPGERVFIEGSPGTSMYVVIDGNIEICVRGKSMEVAGRGSIIGEMALIDSSTRSATVVAQDYCVLAQVNRSQFLSLMQKTPLFGLSVMKTLVTRLRNMDAMM